MTLDPLTDRETEIVLLLADGWRQISISEKLNISVETIKKHLSNIGAKLYTNSSIEVVAWYYRTYWKPKDADEIAAQIVEAAKPAPTGIPTRMARFQEVKDVHYRANMRWAKLSRNHREVNLNLETYYTVAYGVAGEKLCKAAKEFRFRKEADRCAKHYIVSGEMTL